jgi:membrane associated rhomboid family serine protease
MSNFFARRGPFLGLSWALIAVHVGVYFLVRVDQRHAFEALGLDPGAVSFRPWTLFTYQFLNWSGLGLLFTVMSIYFLAMALEHEWGSWTFSLLWLLGVFGASLSAMLVGLELAGSVFLGVSFLCVYAILWPETQFSIFMIIPVKVRYLAVVAAALTMFQAVSLGLARGAIHVAGMGLPVFFYLAFLHPRRSIVGRVMETAKEAGRASADAKLEMRNREFFARASAFPRPAPAAGEPGLEALRTELRAAVASDVRICKPPDYKGDADPVCRRCEGFAECTLRWLDGEPKEIRSS